MGLKSLLLSYHSSFSPPSPLTSPLLAHPLFSPTPFSSSLTHLPFHPPSLLISYSLTPLLIPLLIHPPSHLPSSTSPFTHPLLIPPPLTHSLLIPPTHLPLFLSPLLTHPLLAHYPMPSHPHHALPRRLAGTLPTKRWFLSTVGWTDVSGSGPWVGGKGLRPKGGSESLKNNWAGGARPPWDFHTTQSPFAGSPLRSLQVRFQAPLCSRVLE